MSKYIKLRYDGRWGWIQGQDNRQWTIMSHYVAPDGKDYYKSSKLLQGLKEIEIIP